FFEPALEEMHLGNVWFQQDGATAHTARASMTVLRAKFPGRLISLRGDIPWAAHSPDLTPCDALRNMQQIPQWHCLRYRRFDLVKRCRNYRVAQISAHHEPSESHHTQRITPVAARPLIKVLAEV
ncbi:hypothetical protein B7P43_G13024, partial [Cryptotermes secundus]